MILCLMLYLNDYIRHVLRMKNDTLMLIILYIINYRIHKARTGATLISMHTVVAVRCNHRPIIIGLWMQRIYKDGFWRDVARCVFRRWNILRTKIKPCDPLKLQQLSICVLCIYIHSGPISDGLIWRKSSKHCHSIILWHNYKTDVAFIVHLLWVWYHVTGWRESLTQHWNM